MQQHPVPQPITSYEFRLVGDMTLKQFAKLAAGCIMALIVYAINPPGFLKWPLILLLSGVGAAMAFLPFEGRSIDVWIIAFFKRIYSPTQYIWHQSEKVEITTPKTPKIEGKIDLLPSRPIAPLPIAPPVATAAPPPPPRLVIETVLKKPEPVKPRAPAVQAKFTADVVIPSTPGLPNLLSGYIHDKKGKIIEGAILEIRDSSGIPVRAFKTNKLGQFQSATPLPNGTYEIETEKESFRFDIIKVDLKGAIIPPIEIISK